jgi:hypothetical protein
MKKSLLFVQTFQLRGTIVFSRESKNNYLLMPISTVLLLEQIDSNVSQHRHQRPTFTNFDAPVPFLVRLPTVSQVYIVIPPL